MNHAMGHMYFEFVPIFRILRVKLKKKKFTKIETWLQHLCKMSNNIASFTYVNIFPMNIRCVTLQYSF